jgi:glycosyltransferase involved in cell wall biosynthesis
MAHSARSLVSVLTPFYNTSPYLAECIESVLAQSYSYFEYILADNCSTDGSREIAESYARRDPRIRLVRYSEFVPQLVNYNRALREISEASDYCKIVQADDYIYPECLRLMLQAFAQSETIGLVSSYRLYGDGVLGSGYPHDIRMMAGPDCARWFLRTLIYPFGSQTTVMYRSSIVRAHKRFYNEDLLHADFDKCMEILENWDFAFVPQVLSFTRTANESITSNLLSFAPFALDRYLIALRYAPIFLEAREAASVQRRSKRAYYRILAREALCVPEPAFWRFHRTGLEGLNEDIDWPYLALQIGLVLLWMAANPGSTAVRALRFLKRRMSKKAGFATLSWKGDAAGVPPRRARSGLDAGADKICGGIET